MAPLPFPLELLTAVARRHGAPYAGIEGWSAVEKRRARNRAARRSRRVNRTR